mmetsp:Transcript_5204/g.14981  ORF Transcript_5204/g.14981 Transcript_5204/m.14981 type:complete len:264 (-) Transcript_5204:62-853(-)
MRCLIRAIVASALLHAVVASPPPAEEVDVVAALEADDVCAAGDTAGREACELKMLQLRAGQSAKAEAEASAGMSLMDRALQHKPHHKSQGGGHAGGHGNYKTLYHQTSPSAGASILKTGFRLGTWHAICGSAIYFSPSVSDTEHKAIGGRGFIIEAVVDLGRVMNMPRDCDPHMTGAKLSGMGYDSITLDRGGYVECAHMASCREYIIYDPRRVVSMKGYNHHGWKHWYGPGLAEQNSTVAQEAGEHHEAAEGSEHKKADADN